MEELKEYNKWLNDPELAQEYKDTLLAMEYNTEEIKARFGRRLAFGTGGIRALMGTGLDRFNIPNVKLITRGFANYLAQHKGIGAGIVIGYDGRAGSKKFANITAAVFNACDIKTYMFTNVTQTPLVSFAITSIGCMAGVMITASHNPKEYNGYKAYDHRGIQLKEPVDAIVAQEILKLKDYRTIQTLSMQDAKIGGLYSYVEDYVISSYQDMVISQLINRNVLLQNGRSLSVVYTALQGTGAAPVKNILTKLGIELNSVTSQEEPDPDFLAVKSPNPENIEAFDMAVELAKDKDADIVLATDPDADRAGIMVKAAKGDYRLISGNMVGIIIMEYLLKHTKGHKVLIISTVVSTKAAEYIARANGADYIEVLTGFKYIGEQIFDHRHEYDYIFSFEDSCGYLLGDYIGEKDGVEALAILCEVATYYKTQNKTILAALQDIYENYGYFMEKTISIVFEGQHGHYDMQDILRCLRKEPITYISDLKVYSMKDYSIGCNYDYELGTTVDIDVLKSDMLYYTLEDGSFLCIRPSGTEPKLKVYFGVREDNENKAEYKLDKLASGVHLYMDKRFKCDRIF